MIVGFMLWCNSVYAQHFTERYKTETPDSLVNVRAEWVDFDNNGLLDLAVFAGSATNRKYMMIIPGDTSQSPILSSVVLTLLDADNATMVDLNHDNLLDIISSSDKTGINSEVYINNGSFSFTAMDVNLPYFTVIHFIDLDNDATEECILSGTRNGEPYTNIYLRAEDAWELKSSIKIALASLESVDLDKDGEMELVMSGKDNGGVIKTMFLVNDGNFSFSSVQEFPFTGVISKADVNSDGWMDFALSGINRDGNAINKTLLWQDGRYVDIELLPMSKTYDLFLADLNSDTLVDVIQYGLSNATDSLNRISFKDGSSETISHTNVLRQRFGDLDHDGDLDVAQTLIHSVVVLENNSPKNEPPATPSGNVAVPVFNRLFMYWDKAGDDHTNSAAITYDVLIESGSSKQAADFDLINAKRLRTRHGNNETQNFKLFRDLDGTTWQYAIQSVDHSFHGASKLCVGVGSADMCSGIDVSVITACSGEPVTLGAPATSLWFSFASGFLGTGSVQKFNASESDTIFYFTPGLPACSSIKAFVLGINKGATRITRSSQYACVDAKIPFTATGEWSSISWTSDKLGALGSTADILFPVTIADTVTVTLTNSEGCTLIRKTAVNISQPDLIVQPDKVKLLKGESVQLHANGVSEYLWSPATFLNDIHSADPTSIPLENIQYKVTGTDSVGCTAIGSVIVFVEENAFLPTLFTPNDDGKNDVLKIYGLNNATQFSLTIVNREGKQVYRSSNVSEASTTGWNGKTKGTDQPNGVYFWTVTGQNGGRRLLLNGKESGSLILLR